MINDNCVSRLKFGVEAGGRVTLQRFMTPTVGLQKAGRPCRSQSGLHPDVTAFMCHTGHLYLPEITKIKKK